MDSGSQPPKKPGSSAAVVVFFVVFLIGAAVVFFLVISKSHVKDGGGSRSSSKSVSPSPTDPRKFSKDTLRGMVPSKASSSQNSPEECATWCQAQPNAAYFNFNSAAATNDGDNCFCVTSDEIDNLDNGPKAQCVFHMKGWSSGPVSAQPSALCPSKLVNLSSCHTAKDVGGWPDPQFAEAISPKGDFHDSASCARACELASSEVQAALFYSLEGQPPACGCYRKWTSETACFDPKQMFQDPDVIVDLWAADQDTKCSKDKPLEGCPTVGTCKCKCDSPHIHTPLSCMVDGWNDNNCSKGFKPRCSMKLCSDVSDCSPCRCVKS